MNESALLPAYVPGESLSIGVRVDWQLVGTGGLLVDAGTIARAADDRARLRWPAQRLPASSGWRPGDAPGMLRYASQQHTGRVDALRAELRAALAAMSRLASRRGLALVGGGLHPLQGWTRTAALQPPRPHHPFRVGTLSVRVGCAEADSAVRLAQAMSRFAPHMAALAASSPMAQGVDTGMDSARLQTLHLRPGACALPWCGDWAGYRSAWGRAARAGTLVLRDGEPPWDLRPLPSPGGIEIRVADTPLALEQVLRLAAFARCLARWLEAERPFEPDAGDNALHAHNRMAAARHGFSARLVLRDGRSPWLRDDLSALLERLAPHARALDCAAEIEALALRTRLVVNDAQTIRQWHADGHDAARVVGLAARLLADEVREPPPSPPVPGGPAVSAALGRWPRHAAAPAERVVALTRAAYAACDAGPR